MINISLHKNLPRDNFASKSNIAFFFFKFWWKTNQYKKVTANKTRHIEFEKKLYDLKKKLN